MDSEQQNVPTFVQHIDMDPLKPQELHPNADLMYLMRNFLLDRENSEAMQVCIVDTFLDILIWSAILWPLCSFWKDYGFASNYTL